MPGEHNPLYLPIPARCGVLLLETAQAQSYYILLQGVREIVSGSIAPHTLPLLLLPGGRRAAGSVLTQAGQAALWGQEATSPCTPCSLLLLPSSHSPWPGPLPRQQ